MMISPFHVPVPSGLIYAEARGPFTAGSNPLVFLHGMAGSGADWDRVWAQLPDDWPLLRMDLRGFGQSEGEPGVAFAHTDDLLALLDARGIARAIVVGLSMGGAIAINFALNHAERVAALALVSPAIIGWEWSDEWRRIWRQIARAAKAGLIEQAREAWWLHPMFDQARDHQAGAELRAAIADYHGQQWIRDDQRPELPDLDRLPALTVPTLLLSGACDVPDMRLIADLIAGSAPNVHRVDYANAGHMLHLERAAAVAQEIEGLVRRQD